MGARLVAPSGRPPSSALHTRALSSPAQASAHARPAGIAHALALAQDMAAQVVETDTFFLIWAGALIFLMQCGFATLSAGSIRQKNVKNILLKNVLDACMGALAWYFVGYGFAYNGPTDTVRATPRREGKGGGVLASCPRTARAESRAESPTSRLPEALAPSCRVRVSQ